MEGLVNETGQGSLEKKVKGEGDLVWKFCNIECKEKGKGMRLGFVLTILQEKEDPRPYQKVL